MPAITHYKATRETIGANVLMDEAIPVEDYERFRATLDPAQGYDWTSYYRAWVYNDLLRWEPNFPFSNAGYFGSISDEALYRSNYECVLEELDALNVDYTIDGSSILLDPTDTVAIAKCAQIAEMLDGYPVMDEGHYSELQSKLEDEAFDSYGRDDLIRYLGEHEEFDSILDPDLDEVLPEYAEITESYLFRIATYAVSYSGEMYFSDDAVKDALQDIAYDPADWEKPYTERPTLSEYLQRAATMIRHEKLESDRRIFETVQPPLLDA